MEIDTYKLTMQGAQTVSNPDQTVVLLNKGYRGAGSAFKERTCLTREQLQST